MHLRFEAMHLSLDIATIYIYTLTLQKRLQTNLLQCFAIDDVASLNHVKMVGSILLGSQDHQAAPLVDHVLDLDHLMIDPLGGKLEPPVGVLIDQKSLSLECTFNARGVPEPDGGKPAHADTGLNAGGAMG